MVRADIVRTIRDNPGIKCWSIGKKIGVPEMRVRMYLVTVAHEEPHIAEDDDGALMWVDWEKW